MYPSNDTGLSLAGIFKWLALIFAAVSFYQAYKALVLGQPIDEPGVSLADAGVQSLIHGVVLLVIAFAVWFFWQRNEE